MITYVNGSLFQSPAKTLVNTVNTVGVMGKGIALEFKKIYPDMFDKYQKLCDSKELQIGTLWLYRSPNKWVLNFPTKQDWRAPSRFEYVEAGLKKFVATYDSMKIDSIAFPPLGCGNGQLDFENEIQPLMAKYLEPLPIEVFIYPDKSDDFQLPEHLDTKKMRAWLRSEPQSLPFFEVWEDFLNLFEKTSAFETVVNESEFKAEINDDPLGITIIKNGTARKTIQYETLVSFWQQLRDHGFSYRAITGVERDNISYLVPIFQLLEYVKPVKVAENYTKLHWNNSIGLQVMPLAFAQSREHKQESFFDLVDA